MSWVGRFAGAVQTGAVPAGAVLAAVMASASCAAAGGGSAGEGAASCAYRILYEGRAYQDVADAEFTIGRRPGDATLPACDDTGGEDEAEEAGTTLAAYEVAGISPRVAVAVGETPGEAVLVAVSTGTGTGLPVEVRKLIDGS
ncbi:DUF6281 family protein [Streptomyces sp. ME02-8801-2C]|uniref:DUF6281 family protein n=1 Tax=Streptomyces sp. ME02-8801-2C TaxID=3028680 RepID=UPI0029A068E0|nr:DUF6281 family protein [Streptomyces sp. ME02-8801-2C]MDX3457413.1 DUF6281 family protein [Streptomyces sp. ME02-8801-2C]